MRRILVDQARRKAGSKSGGQHKRLELPELAEPSHQGPLDLLALDEALQTLEQQQPDKAEIVKLRFFAGCSVEETAQALGISRATAQRKWAYARAWLFGQLNQS